MYKKYILLAIALVVLFFAVQLVFVKKDTGDTTIIASDVDIEGVKNILKKDLGQKKDQTADDQEDEYMLPGSDSRYIAKSELKGFSKFECRVARNEIYARHGRIFKNKRLKDYFNSKSWYRPKYTAKEFHESWLNGIERTNLNRIVRYEKKMGYR